MSPEQAADIAIEVPGLMTRTELACLAGLVRGAGSVLEIGCYKGRSTTAIALMGNTVFSVDDFSLRYLSEPQARGTPERHHAKEEFAVAQRKLDGRSVLLYRDAAASRRRLTDALLVLFPEGMGAGYIDGSHDYESVSSDIAMCLDVVRKGGIVCGHDLNLEGVRRAVVDAFGKMPEYDEKAGMDNKMWWVTKR